MMYVPYCYFICSFYFYYCTIVHTVHIVNYTVRKEVKCSGDSNLLQELVCDTTQIQKSMN